MLPPGIEKIAAARRIPLSAQFELTWRCNLNCLHCYQFKAGGRELTGAKIKSILGELAGAGTLYLSFTGGEPLLREDFWEIAEQALGLHFALILQTNGTLIDAAAARRLKELNFFAVHISLHGSDPRTHDGITRVPGSFRKAMGAASLLRANGLSVIFNLTLLNRNFSERGAAARIAEKAAPGCEIRMSPIVFARNDRTSDNGQFTLETRQLKKYVREQRQAGKRLPRGLTCDFGITSCAVNALGKVYPCAAVPVEAGDLREDTFARIWRSSPLLRRIRRSAGSEPVSCRCCQAKKHCFRCAGLSYGESGNMFGCSAGTKKLANIQKEEVHCNEKTKI